MGKAERALRHDPRSGTQAARPPIESTSAGHWPRKSRHISTRFGIGPRSALPGHRPWQLERHPDNIGPLTVSKLLVTRHLYEYHALSEEILGRMRPVAALSLASWD